MSLLTATAPGPSGGRPRAASASVGGDQGGRVGSRPRTGSLDSCGVGALLGAQTRAPAVASRVEGAMQASDPWGGPISQSEASLGRVQRLVVQLVKSALALGAPCVTLCVAREVQERLRGLSNLRHGTPAAATVGRGRVTFAFKAHHAFSLRNPWAGTWHASLSVGGWLADGLHAVVLGCASRTVTVHSLTSQCWHAPGGVSGALDCLPLVGPASLQSLEASLEACTCRPDRARSAAVDALCALRGALAAAQCPVQLARVSPTITGDPCGGHGILDAPDAGASRCTCGVDAVRVTVVPGSARSARLVHASLIPDACTPLMCDCRWPVA